MSQPQHPSPSQLILHRALLSNRTPQFPWQLPHVVSALEAEGRRAADRRYVALQSPTLPVPCRPSCLSPSPPGSPAEATQSPQGKKRRDSGTKAARSLPQNVSLTCVILRYCPVGQHFVVLCLFKERPEKILSRTTPSPVSHRSSLCSGVGIWFWGLGSNSCSAASSCVTFLRLCPLFTGGWAHLLLGVAMGKQMSRHLGKYFVKE